MEMDEISFNQYQRLAKTTDIYPEEQALICHIFGLLSEAGEVADKVKKIFRDKNGKFSDESKKEIAYELGDVLWYISNIAYDIDFTLDEIQEINIQKLSDRKERNKIGGSGDHR